MNTIGRPTHRLVSRLIAGIALAACGASLLIKWTGPPSNGDHRTGASIVFIDSRLPGQQQLARASAGADRSIFFDDRDSADDLISAVVGDVEPNHVQIASIAVVSHGRPGGFAFGGDWITSDDLKSPAWARLRGMLAPSARLFLYGCDVGRRFNRDPDLVDRLAELTGAVVYASDDVTGAGGDWDLEVDSGGAEATVDQPGSPIRTALLGAYGGSLAVANLAPDADSYISASSNMNYGSAIQILIRRWLSSWSTRGLVHFDLSSIPEDVTISSATLNVTIVSNSGHAKTIDVHSVVRSWVETQVTWAKADVSTSWTTLGGDFTVTPVASAAISAFATAGTVVSFDVTADVQAFYATPASNFGWLLKDSAEPASGGGEYVTIASRQHATSAYHPELVVTYANTPGVSVSGISGPTTEAGGTATFTIVLNTQPAADVAVGLTSSDATEGSVLPPSVTFTDGDWNVPQVVTVAGTDDDVDDDDVAYTIVTAAATSADADYDGMDPADVAVTNTDDDTAGISVAEVSGPTTEAGGTAIFMIALDSEPTTDVSVGLSSSDTSEGTVLPASVTFMPWDWRSPHFITLTGVDDDVDDGDVVYSVITATAVSADGNYDGMNPADVAVTNTDDDTAGINVSAVSGPTTEAGGTATFTIVLDTQPAADVVIGLASSDGTEGSVLPASVTFTDGDWSVPQAVSVAGIDDDIDDDDVAYTIITAAATSADADYDGMDPADVVVTNTDDDTAGISVSAVSGPTTEIGGTASFTIVLNSEPTASVTVGLTSSDTSEGTILPATVTFMPGDWDTPQLVTLTGVDDDVDDGDAIYTAVAAAATSADGHYNGINPADVAVVNTDDDTAGISVSPIAGPTTEMGSTATFTIVLDSEPTDDVTVAVSSSDTSEGTVLPPSITFTTGDWNVPETFTVTGVDDDVQDGDVAYSIVTSAASSLDGNYDGLDPANVAVTNTDNDSAGITVSSISGATTEWGTMATFTIVLNTEPTGNVTLPVSSADLSEGTVMPGSVTFTPADWDLEEVFTVTGLDDDVADGDVPFSITVGAATSTDPNYDEIDAGDVAVTNTDDDVAGITLTESGGSTNVDEAGTSDTYEVVLQSEPTADVTVSATPDAQSDIGAGPGGAIDLVFTAADWDQPWSVTVTPVDDAVDEGAHTSTIMHTVSSADADYDALPMPAVTANIADDDTASVIVTETEGSTTVREGDASDTYSVVLASQPTAAVSVTVTPDNQIDVGAGAAEAVTFAFAVSDWDQPWIVTVRAVDDAVIEGTHASSIVHAAESADPNYDGMAAPNVAVNVLDNDLLPPPTDEAGGGGGGGTSLSARSDQLVTDGGGPLEITLASYSAAGTGLTFEIISAPAHGTLIGAPPHLQYVPDAGFSGIDRLSYVVIEGGRRSLPASIVIEVRPMNRAPVGVAQSISLLRDHWVLIVLEGEGADETDDLNFEIVTLPAHGALTGTAPELVYAPDAGFVGTDRFAYVVSDGQTVSDEAVVTISVGEATRHEGNENGQQMTGAAGTLVAEAGPDRDVGVRERVIFDASGSHLKPDAVAGPVRGDPIEIANFRWDFDASNGITVDAVGDVVEWQYNQPGRFTVTLVVTDSLGRNASDTFTCTASSIADEGQSEPLPAVPATRFCGAMSSVALVLTFGCLIGMRTLQIPRGRFRRTAIY